MKKLSKDHKKLLIWLGLIVTELNSVCSLIDEMQDSLISIGKEYPEIAYQMNDLANKCDHIEPSQDIFTDIKVQIDKILSKDKGK